MEPQGREEMVAAKTLKRRLRGAALEKAIEAGEGERTSTESAHYTE